MLTMYMMRFSVSWWHPSDVRIFQPNFSLVIIPLKLSFKLVVESSYPSERSISEGPCEYGCKLSLLKVTTVMRWAASLRASPELLDIRIV